MFLLVASFKGLTVAMARLKALLDPICLKHFTHKGIFRIDVVKMHTATTRAVAQSYILIAAATADPPTSPDSCSGAPTTPKR